MSTLPAQTNDPRGIDAQSSIVRTLAVVGTIFGVLGLSCLPFNLADWITYGWPIEGEKTTVMDVWCLLSTFIGMGLSGLLVAGSLGAYHFRWWARDVLLLWAWLSLAYGILGIYFWGRFLLPRYSSRYAEMRGPDEVSGVIAWIIGTGLAIFVLRFLNRPSIAAVFVGSPPHGPPGAAHH